MLLESPFKILCLGRSDEPSQGITVVFESVFIRFSGRMNIFFCEVNFSC